MTRDQERTIVCATDFSAAAQAATQLAATLARALRAQVQLVHAIEPLALIAGDPSVTRPSLEVALKETAERELAAAVADLQARGVRAQGRVVVDDASVAIKRAAGAGGVQLVVMGTHGRKGAAHFFLGSVAEKVARNSPVPVVATRGLPYPAEGLAGHRRLHLLVAADGSPAAEAALAWVKAFRREVPCDLTFVQPYWPPEEARRFGLPRAWAGHQGDPSLLPLLERELRRWIGAIPGEGEVRLQFRPFHGVEAQDIADVAELVQPDLMIVGTSERVSTRPHLSASAALRAVHVPVVCVPESLRPASEGRIPYIGTVLVGTDLSPFANQAIPAAYALLRGTGGTVELCYVYESGIGSDTAMDLPATPPLTTALRGEVEAQLAHLVPPEAAALGIESRVAVVDAAAAPDGLIQRAERIGADVVVLASHGRTGLGRALRGSVAEEVVRRCARPVMVLHPPRR